MTESLVWNKESILNIDKDTMYASTGTVTVNDKSLVLGAKSSATYDYTFDTTDNILETSDLQFILNVINSNKTVSSRYDESVQVETYIKYYEKQVDSSGNITGYVLGNTDTYQINPYFRHESEGYTDTYEVSIEKNYTVEIKIMFINNSDNTVTFVNPRVFNSMAIMDAIDEYGGGGQSGGDTPPLIDALTLYSLEEKYTIDTMDGSLTLQVYIPDEYLKKYSKDEGFNYDIDLNWIFTNESGKPIITASYSYYISVLDGEDYHISDGRCILTAIGNGVKKVRVELAANNTIYTERLITIRNNNVTDMQLVINSQSGKIDGNNILNGYIKILPEMTRSGQGGLFDDVETTIVSYDGGKATITSGGKYLIGGVIPFTVIGRANGKVKITVKVRDLSKYDYQQLSPPGFTKEFIVDVVNVTGHVFVDTPDGTVLDNTKEYIDLILTTNYGTGMILKNFSVQSLDGNGNAVATKIIDEDYKAGLRIYALSIGKVKVTGYISNRQSGMTFNDYFEQEIDITGLYKELTTEITTNTGLFEITDGGGQLVVYCKPNYSYYGGISFSQASIDGGSVSIKDRGNDALLIADKNGRLYLTCTPTNGSSKQVEITISGQYPEDVQLTCADNIFKVPINGTLMIYAEAGNKPNSNYDMYDWISEKLDSDVNWETTSWDKYIRYKGLNLGKIRVSAVRKVDSKFMTSQVIKVVQSLDSDKTVLNYPNSQQYWVVYRRIDQGNRLWLLTIAGTVTLDKLIKKNDNRLYTDNITLGARAQWKIESGQWANHGSWSGDTSPAGSVGQLYASNIDIYDEKGNLLVAKTGNYDDVDFDKIIYG